MERRPCSLLPMFGLVAPIAKGLLGNLEPSSSYSNHAVGISSAAAGNVCRLLLLLYEEYNSSTARCPYVLHGSRSERFPAGQTEDRFSFVCSWDERVCCNLHPQQCRLRYSSSTQTFKCAPDRNFALPLGVLHVRPTDPPSRCHLPLFRLGETPKRTDSSTFPTG